MIQVLAVIQSPGKAVRERDAFVQLFFGDKGVFAPGDAELAKLSHIDLTTIGQDAGRLAELAVGRAVARLEGEVFVDDELVVSPSLVVRRTTAQPRET